MLSPLSKLPPNAKVGVVGGGVSGLMFTYFLSKLRSDIKITLFEGEKRTGGWINSWNTADQNGASVMLERGPRTLRGVSDGTVVIMDTMNDLGKSDSIRCVEKYATANRKFLLGPNDKLVQVPNSFGSFLKFATSPLSKGLFTGIAGEMFRKSSSTPGKDESVRTMLNRRYGNDFIASNLMSAIYHGIYADDISTLSAQKTSGKVFYTELKHGSVLRGSIKEYIRNRFGKKQPETLSGCLKLYQRAFNKDTGALLKLSNHLKKYPMLGFVGGLETFPKTIRKELDNIRNVEIVTGSAVTKMYKDSKNSTMSVKLSTNERIDGFDHLRITVTPQILSTLITSTYGDLIKDLKKVKSNTVILINYYLPNKEIIRPEIQSFGYLIPQSNTNPANILGVIFDSVIEKNFKSFNIDDANPSRLEVSSSGQSSELQYTKLTIMVGGHLLNENGKTKIPAEATCLADVKSALETHLNVSREDLDNGLWVYTVAKECFPHYFIGYKDWQNKLEKTLLTTYDNKISLGGMGFAKGPGVPDVIVDGLQDALKLK
ncbi:oxygen-dependent protoporphyrinogen oxidase NDAI_0E03610 [Naumovozyma dairenensis CBS 421]|uniref:Protoporphyrinogen oxidase n=1 Tax=Naumovozyma dairenensis (strain ATCC 10597 / BCRC 20456 / CBS 421 / NBRC 0211 / NRRL Y-12639) TaxID=1071378 RepID=G0WBQ8_NAUDC|nr:hypothetical protein NDAI_0E03610 [Naumovozyma dairenensis CBS 421]CCD25178.1 hypothetical protein NDAI_0E03610 [Naumovozyma dairenensis CBS 421]